MYTDAFIRFLSSERILAFLKVRNVGILSHEYLFIYELQPDRPKKKVLRRSQLQLILSKEVTVQHIPRNRSYPDPF